MKNEILMACYQLLSAAANGTYQGILITVLVAASLRMLRRTNAATRYAVWFGTLLLLALIIPAHCLRSGWDAGGSHANIEGSVSAPALPPELYAAPAEAIQLTMESNDQARSLAADADFQENERGIVADHAIEQKNLDFATSSAINGQTLEDVVRPLVPATLPDIGLNQVEPGETRRPGWIANIKQKLSWLGERMLTPLPSWTMAPKIPLWIAALLPMTWLAIAGAKVSLLIWQLFRIRKLKLNSTEPGPELNAQFLSLRRTIGVRRDVALRVSRDHKSPVVLGFFKPAILMPADTGIEGSEHILRHELAHVSRRDDWANLVQHFTKAVFFFHPAIWWVSKRISLEREIACDDQVLQSSSRPKAYALLLAELAGRMQASVLAPGVSTNQSQLKQRIDMILNTNRNSSPRLSKGRLGLLATAAAFMAVAVIYAAPRLAFAQSKDAPAPTLAPPAPPDESSGAVALSAPVAVVAVEADTPPAAPPDFPSALPTTPPVPAGPKFKPGSAPAAALPPSDVPRAPIAIFTGPLPALPSAPSVALAPSVPSVALTPAAPSLTLIPAPPSPALPSVAPVPALIAPVPAAPIVASADPYSAPDLPAQPRPARRSGRDASLEERLDRLEKIVESLIAQQNKNPGRDEYTPKVPRREMNPDGKPYPEHAKQWELQQADMAKKQAEFDLKRADVEKQLKELEKRGALKEGEVKEKVKELAEQHAKLAADQERFAKEASRAAREAERASRDSQKETVRKMRDGSHQELEALRRQHEALERQMEKLDRQIEKLERDQEQFEERQENDELDQDVKLSGNNSCDKQPGEPANNNLFAPGQPAAR